MRSNSRLVRRFLFPRFLSALLIVSIAFPPSFVYALRPLAGRESGMEEKLSSSLQSAAAHQAVAENWRRTGEEMGIARQVLNNLLKQPAILTQSERKQSRTSRGNSRALIHQLAGFQTQLESLQPLLAVPVPSDGNAERTTELLGRVQAAIRGTWRTIHQLDEEARHTFYDELYPIFSNRNFSNRMAVYSELDDWAQIQGRLHERRAPSEPSGSPAGQEEKPGGDWKQIRGDARYMNQRGSPRWGLNETDWAALWFLLEGRVANDRLTVLADLKRMRFERKDNGGSWGDQTEALVEKFIGLLEDNEVTQWGRAVAVAGLALAGVSALALIAQQAMMIPPQVGRPVAIDPFADEPAVVKSPFPRAVQAEALRFKWQGEGPIAERDGEQIDFNDWDKLGQALSPEQVDLFLREQEGAESWLVPADAALPINRAIHVFDQVGIPAQQLPQNLNYFNLSDDAATEVTPDLLERGIKDGDVVILRADQVTPDGAKNLIPEGIKARVVLLTPLMLKQITARQLLFVAGQLDPGETLWIQHLSYATLEGQRYLLIAA